MSPAIMAMFFNMGLTIIQLFIRNETTRAKYIANWTEWVNQRGKTADNTVEIKKNLDQQQADLDAVQKTLDKNDPSKKVT